MVALDATALQSVVVEQSAKYKLMASRREKECQTFKTK